MPKRFAFVHLGVYENYSLMYVAGEVLKHKHTIQWFDDKSETIIDDIIAWAPDFVMFSPLTTHFATALRISNELKDRIDITCVFGGHHVLAAPESIEMDGVDILIKGPVYGTIDKIITADRKSLINGDATEPSEMYPARREYYDAVPRIRDQVIKYIMSHFGCIYNCSYCSTSVQRGLFGNKIYRENWLKRRPIEHLIEEAKIIKEYPLDDLEWVDDDILMDKGEEELEPWLEKFSHAWKEEIGLKFSATVTPPTAVRASDRSLDILSELVSCVMFGVQSARKESLKLFKRYQNEEMVKKAIERFAKHNIKVRLDIIVGLPVADPVEEALDTIKLLQRVGQGTYISCYPLQVFRGTGLYNTLEANKVDLLEQHGWQLNDETSMDFSKGVGSIKFDPETARKIHNICRLAQMFVKYNVDEHWMRTVIEMDINESAAKMTSECKFYERVKFSVGDRLVESFEEFLVGKTIIY